MREKEGGSSWGNQAGGIKLGGSSLGEGRFYYYQGIYCYVRSRKIVRFKGGEVEVRSPSTITARIVTKRLMFFVRSSR